MSTPVVSREFAERFADAWVAAWNSGDLERILAHYSDDFEMRSPLIAERGLSADGILRGKDAIAAYWKAGLALQPPLRFELLHVCCGVGALALHYRSHGRGKLVIERIAIGPDDKGIRAEALYCDDEAG